MGLVSLCLLYQIFPSPPHLACEPGKVMSFCWETAEEEEGSSKSNNLTCACALLKTQSGPRPVIQQEESSLSLSAG